MFHPNFRLSRRIVRVNHDNRRIGRARVNRVKNCVKNRVKNRVKNSVKTVLKTVLKQC